MHGFIVNIVTYYIPKCPKCNFHTTFLVNVKVMNVCALVNFLWPAGVGTAKALQQRHLLWLQTYEFANVWQGCSFGVEKWGELRQLFLVGLIIKMNYKYADISIRKIIKVFNIYELDLRFQISKPFRVTAKTIDELKNIVLGKNICSWQKYNLKRYIET